MLRYLGQRAIMAIPTLILISIVSFIIIQLPPGDYLTTYIAQLEPAVRGAVNAMNTYLQ